MFAAKNELLTRPSGGAYQISRSLRFNNADTTVLDRTPVSAGNQKTWTWSAWVKLNGGSVTQYFFAAGAVASSGIGFRWSGGGFSLRSFTSGAGTQVLQTTQLIRDFSAWYHIVLAVDTTQATDTNRAKLYLNGSQVTAFDATTYPAQNTNYAVNDTVDQGIGWLPATGSYYNGYMTEVYLIDGQALTPSSFGATSVDTGVWGPKAYTGTYGTNGFYLNFSDNSNTTAATLGKDYSGNGNNFTPTNFSVTAGAGNDSMVDSPTLYGTDTGVGGEVRGNYCTWNRAVRVYATPAFSDGNLVITGPADWGAAQGTIGVTSGKWYWEVVNGNSDVFLGVCGSNMNMVLASIFDVTGAIMYNGNGTKSIDGVDSAYGASYSTETIGVALDITGGTVTFYKSNVSQGSISLSLSTLNGYTIFPITIKNGSTSTGNWGQRAFAYTAPSGFLALCTQNFPTPTVGATATTLAGKYFNPVLYTGTGSSLSVTGVGFQPDWVWAKGRSGATDHALYDAVRGVQKQIESNNTGAETTETTGLTAFGSDGFTTGALAQMNTSAATYVAWNWKANGSGSTNTAGSITSTVSASTTAGFSVVTYTGTGAGGTIGHGIGAALSMLIIKRRSSSANDSSWLVGHVGVVMGTGRMILNGTDANNASAGASLWNSTAATSTVFSVGNYTAVNESASTYVAYCFAPIAGYSAFGSYTGTGNADGPFVFTGFRPAFVIIKDTTAAQDWMTFDSARNTYNATNLYLQPNQPNAEASGIGDGVDLLSNGFKIRSTNGTINSDTDVYIYMAFASSPFKYSLAR